MKWEVAIDAWVGHARRGEDRRFHLEVAFASDAARLVLFGPSGAGKSLTLMAIAGLLSPARGHVRVSGETLFDAAAQIDVPARGRRLGYVFQDYALFQHLTVRQNVAFGLAPGWRNPPRRGFGDDRDARVDAWLARLELDRLGDRFPEQLSGGQRQRAALARALVAEPRAILLDEPFSALDGALRVRLRDELAELQRRLSLPMILITHDPADAAAFADATIVIDGGRVVVEADRAEPDPPRMREPGNVAHSSRLAPDTP